MLNKANLFFRTELNNTMCQGKEMIYFVRNKNFSLMNLIVRTILIPILQPRALPWAIIFRPFRTFLSFPFLKKDRYQEFGLILSFQIN